MQAGLEFVILRNVGEIVPLAISRDRAIVFTFTFYILRLRPNVSNQMLLECA